LDLKLHDIPNTAAKCMGVLCDHKVDMVTVHTLGGFEMMRCAREEADQKAASLSGRPLIVGVTVLTSHDETMLKNELGISKDLKTQVCDLAVMAHKAGLDGVVSSPQEISFIRGKIPEPFILVTPGVRPKGSDIGDQKRVFTPQQALTAGASYLVIGRPITKAKDPRQAAEAILSFGE